MQFIKDPLLYKPVVTWSNRDFVRYFSNKLKDRNGFCLSIPNGAWVYFVGQVKNFREQLHISEEDYKIFIDKVTEVLFSKPGTIPAFGAIVSKKVYNMFTVTYNVTKTTNFTYTNDDFKKLRDTLLADTNLVFNLGNSYVETN